MDEIQGYREHAAAPAHSRVPAVPGHPHPHHPIASAPPSVAKAPSDYLRALRRRIWLVLLVSGPLGVMTSIWAIRQPSIYRAVAEIGIEPPELNPMLSALVARDIAPRSPSNQSQYIADRLAQLQSAGLAEMVVSDSRVVHEMNQFADPARELLNCLQIKSNPKTTWSLVTVENQNPMLAKELLEVLIEKFKELTRSESKRSVEEVKFQAEQNLKNLRMKQASLDQAIEKALEDNRDAIGPSGRNMFEEELVQHNNRLMQKEAQLGEVHYQAMVAQLFPREMQDELASPVQGRIAELERSAKMRTGLLRDIKEKTRHFNSEPAAKYHARLLKEDLTELKELQSMPVKQPEKTANPTEMIVDQRIREIEGDKATKSDLLARLRESMPGYKRYLALEEDRKLLKEEIAKADSNISAFAILSQSQQDPVQVTGNGNVKEPTVPVRPNRMISIVMGLCFSLAVGIALVCLLEHIDHRVKVPEHVTHGLTLPLLGVIPRMRRTSRNHRAGHLWTPGAPESLEADAFRNVRASLLGVADRSGPIVTMLVTSAKAGEGKSTSALNLAATCAKAGERTLLLDIDLRRGSLGDVFAEEEEDGHDDDPKRGLVDVLRGRLPWQRTVRRTPIANLDFIPTGDTFDIPIEILGTRELRQLILALSHHYDRVILDGPAVLGLADCLVLGRVVDSTVLVVRSGAHQLTTLYRAKGMLEQARVPIAGVIFNSLSEGLDSWSSYVTEQPAIGASGGSMAGGRAAAELVAPGRRPDPEDAARVDEEGSYEFAGSAGSGRS